MSDTKPTPASRVVYWACLIVMFLTACLAAALLYLQMAGMKFPGDILPFNARSAARLSVMTIDSSDSWNWNWNAPHCAAAFTEWLAPQDIKTLELTLINPQDHDLELPLQVQYQSDAGQTATAGAWCETASRQRIRGLSCVAAPLAVSDPNAATTALTGAVAQAVTYALNPNVFGEAQGRPWTWSQWQPLVAPTAAGEWHSACPTLSAEATRD